MYKINPSERSIIKVSFNGIPQAFYQSGGANTGELGNGVWFPFDGISDKYANGYMAKMAFIYMANKQKLKCEEIPEPWFCRLGNAFYATISYNLGGGFWEIYNQRQIQTLFAKYYNSPAPSNPPGIWKSQLPKKITLASAAVINKFIGTSVSMNSVYRSRPHPVQIKWLQKRGLYPINIGNYLGEEGHVNQLAFTSPSKYHRLS